MSETKEITRLHVVIDSETSYDNIGDIDGGLFDFTWLVTHIKSHGAEGLIIKLAEMQTQVIDTRNMILRTESSEYKPTLNSLK